jgi:plasmid stabilization system protein ParE
MLNNTKPLSHIVYNVLSNYSRIVTMQGRVHNTRELIVSGTPLIIPYRVKNKNVEILRVFHSAMQWPEEI